MALQRNNDIVQIAAEDYGQADEDGKKIYIPIVKLDAGSCELLEQQITQLKIMNKHLSILTGQFVSEDEVEGGELNEYS